MPDQPKPVRIHLTPSPRLATALCAGAGAVAGLAVMIAAVRIGGPVSTGAKLDLAETMNDACLIVVGLGVAGALYALSRLVRIVHRLQANLSETTTLLREVHAGRTTAPELTANPDAPMRVDASTESGPDAPPVGDPPWDEILELLRETRDNSLLSEDQRREKAARVETDEIDAVQRAVKAAARLDELRLLRQRLDVLSRKYPGRAALTTLRQALEQAFAAREKEDLAAFTRRVDEMITISAWERAREACEEFSRLYPESVAGRQVAARVEREFELHEDAQRTRMSAEIQRLVARKRWREALSAARAFIDRFPYRPESSGLAMQIETLRYNADVATRQDLDAEITELAKRGQYAEAEAMANRVIEMFPDSPQAEILRSQLDRLHELATNPDAPPPRVRPTIY